MVANKSVRLEDDLLEGLNMAELHTGIDQSKLMRGFIRVGLVMLATGAELPVVGAAKVSLPKEAQASLQAVIQ